MVVDQPDWLQWVRRVPPQDDAERIVATSPNETVVIEEPLQESQKRVEWPDLPDLTGPEPEGDRNSRRVLKIKQSVRISTAQNAQITEEHSEVAAPDTLGIGPRDS